MIYEDITKTVGNTPIIKLDRLVRSFGLCGTLLAKTESRNPLGSSKDRVGIAIVENALASGKLTVGGTVIEATSGNTGIGLAMACAVKGCTLVLTMPETMSIERRKLLSALGATVVLTDGKLGMAGAVQKAQEILESTPNSIIANQFSNLVNPQIHRETTAKEILADTDGNIDYFVASVGTGGTLSGIAEVLKKENKGVSIVAVEPKASPLLSKGVSGAHKIQGIGANFIPETLNRDVIDQIIAVSDDDAYLGARALGKTEGFTCGISGGATLYAGLEILKNNPNSCVLVFLADGGDRYLSTDLFEEE